MDERVLLERAFGGCDRLGEFDRYRDANPQGVGVRGGPRGLARSRLNTLGRLRLAGSPVVRWEHRA